MFDNDDFLRELSKAQQTIMRLKKQNPELTDAEIKAIVLEQFQAAKPRPNHVLEGFAGLVDELLNNYIT